MGICTHGLLCNSLSACSASWGVKSIPYDTVLMINTDRMSIGNTTENNSFMYKYDHTDPLLDHVWAFMTFMAQSSSIFVINTQLDYTTEDLDRKGTCMYWENCTKACTCMCLVQIMDKISVIRYALHTYFPLANWMPVQLVTIDTTLDLSAKYPLQLGGPRQCEI